MHQNNLIPYNFLDISLSETFKYNFGDKLLKKEIDGIIINNFLTRDDISKIINGFDELPNKDLTVINEGFIAYPLSFAQCIQGITSKKISEEDYYNIANDYRATFSKKFGVDIESKFKALFEQIFPERTLNVPLPTKNNGSFVPFNFRKLFPDYGELKIHCENLFFNEFPEFFKLMSHAVKRKNDFSFFVVLQKAENGGGLRLFDARWKENEVEEFKEIGDTNNFVAAIESQNLNTQLINPEEGSIVVFSGGDIWHKIEKVLGTKSRITLGGFVSSGVEPNKMYFWA
jgi:hypothetical protein